MSYPKRLFFFIIIDSSIVIMAIFLASFLTHATVYVFSPQIIITSAVILGCHHLFSLRYKLYKKLWEYASIKELLVIFKVVSLSILMAALSQQIVMNEIQFRLLAVTWLLHMFLLGGSRFIWRMYRDSIIRHTVNKQRTLIIGAGSAGTMIARQLLHNEDCQLLPVAFIDDDMHKQHLDIYGLPVIGGTDAIAASVQQLEIEHIIIAIPSLSKKELNQLIKQCASTKANTKILPLIEDLVTGKVSINQFRDVQVEELLGRDPVEMNIKSISKKIENQTVLITGAGGSIGSEIARQVAAFQPKQLILLGHGENSIYTIEMELSEVYKGKEIIFITEIADIQDEMKMMKVMEKYKPDVVYHAAAHKHVPLMEKNPEAAVKNNMIGTMNVAKAASRVRTDIFVMISTDKAVHPTSVMGASKRLAEMIVQDMNNRSNTKFVAVRFGNVLGSAGSVIPLFQKQIEKGGPVTVTHPDMERYFMTIPEASRLVMQAGALASGGEIFVLDMGKPVKIIDLAKNLIKLSGNRLEDIDIVYTGIRPGEKLFEELLKDNEVHEDHIYPKIYVGKTTELPMLTMKELLEDFYRLDGEILKERMLSLANNQIIHEEKTALPV